VQVGDAPIVPAPDILIRNEVTAARHSVPNQSEACVTRKRCFHCERFMPVEVPRNNLQNFSTGFQGRLAGIRGIDPFRHCIWVDQ
jgi:hypothetical protein